MRFTETYNNNKWTNFGDRVIKIVELLGWCKDPQSLNKMNTGILCSSLIDTSLSPSLKVSIIFFGKT